MQALSEAEDAKALIENVVLHPIADECSINGAVVDEPTRLRQGNVIQLGRTNIFRFNHPTEAKRLQKLRADGFEAAASELDGTDTSGAAATMSAGKMLEEMQQAEEARLEKIRVEVEAMRAGREGEISRPLLRGVRERLSDARS